MTAQLATLEQDLQEAVRYYEQQIHAIDLISEAGNMNEEINEVAAPCMHDEDFQLLGP
jgi:hypothetical protein